MYNDISVSKITKGNVYYIDFHDERKCRPCLVVGESKHYGENVLIMTITTQEDIPNLLPILLDDKISFIRTSGISEIPESEINTKKYIGRVSNNVLDLAISMFSLRLLNNDDNKFQFIKERYNEYSNKFSKLKLKGTQINFKFENEKSTVVDSINIEFDNKDKYPYSLSQWSDKQLKSFRHDSFSMNNDELKSKYQCDDRRLGFLQRYVKKEINTRKIIKTSIKEDKNNGKNR